MRRKQGFDKAGRRGLGFILALLWLSPLGYSGPKPMNLPPKEAEQKMEAFRQEWAPLLSWEEHKENRKFLEKAWETGWPGEWGTDFQGVKVPYLGKVKRLRIFRRMAPGGQPLTRMELTLPSGEEELVFLDNEEGHFLQMRGHWFALSENPMRAYVDSLAEPIHSTELDFALFWREEAQFQGQPCQKITMRTLPEWRAMWRLLPGHVLFLLGLELQEGGDQDSSKRTLAPWHRPMTRIFLVDAQGRIRSREHYDAFGKRVYARTCGLLKEKPEKAVDFSTPKAILRAYPTLEFAWWGEDMNRRRQPVPTAQEPSVKSPRKTSSLPWYKTGRGRGILLRLLLAGSLLLLGGAVLLQRRRRP